MFRLIYELGLVALACHPRHLGAWGRKIAPSMSAWVTELVQAWAGLLSELCLKIQKGVKGWGYTSWVKHLPSNPRLTLWCRKTERCWCWAVHLCHTGIRRRSGDRCMLSLLVHFTKLFHLNRFNIAWQSWLPYRFAQPVAQGLRLTAYGRGELWKQPNMKL